MECDRNNFSSFASHFLPFITLLTPKIWKKCKKMEIFSFYTCTITEDHMMYGSWDIRHNRVFCHFGLFFCRLSLQPWKILKKWNKCLEISFYTCIPQMTTLRCMVLEIWSTTEFFVILDYLLPFYLPKNPENQNFERMKKILGDIILHMCT